MWYNIYFIWHIVKYYLIHNIYIISKSIYIYINKSYYHTIMFTTIWFWSFQTFQAQLWDLLTPPWRAHWYRRRRWPSGRPGTSRAARAPPHCASRPLGNPPGVFKNGNRFNNKKSMKYHEISWNIMKYHEISFCKGTYFDFLLHFLVFLVGFPRWIDEKYRTRWENTHFISLLDRQYCGNIVSRSPQTIHIHEAQQLFWAFFCSSTVLCLFN